MDQEQRINQTNNCSISKELSDKIELIQSNTSTVQGDINDELKITQTNTNIIRKKVTPSPTLATTVAQDTGEPEVLPESSARTSAIVSKTAGEPEVLMERIDRTPIVSGSSTPEQVPVQVNVLPEPSIPQQVFWALDTVGGKIREQIANQFFKTKLLELISRARRFLELGKVAEAVAVLTVIGDELEFIYDSAPCEKPPFNQVRRVLVEAEKTLAGIL